MSIGINILLNGRIYNLRSTALPGGTGVIGQGILRPEETNVAVKVCRCAGTSNQQVGEHVVREVQTLASLQHENILPILGIVTEFSGISMVTPWRERGNANDYVQDVNVDPRPLLRGIANGLSYLHSHNPGPIVHGNLKGTNVLISDDGSPQLTDICCSFTSPPGMQDNSVSCALRWMAPERIDGNGEVNTKDDVWAFGMMALELFTRGLPFYNISERQGVILRILEGPPDRPSNQSTHSRMSDEWWSMCLSCWDVNPSTRPQMFDVMEAIPDE
ncbi:hypothetical protein SCLCIDRAFT_494998 [Scleroderma citrinum Foug A]|uniref:Protein kinase domain-containing protein n=1 Tax=Scleroderma citrinum Foug A TaxID=1036808 RepID=A0A0C3EP51_9AGAM|nr:hypothetical protein SCLCIDRAFT_494998 [Scleroderma citrinum Foug A]